MAENTRIEQWLSPEQAGRRLGVSSQRIRQMIRQGVLTAVRTANGRLVEPESVERLAMERAGAPGG